ncbi:MAG TPA: LysR substrate-binding domain-containing protein, partial [Gammaproteobacteria bacterium]|nr:LysR substrate-binding domain-containing protein [Gammaproteobacteria bacterium]
MDSLTRARGIRIQQLLLVSEVARQGNLARAADALHLTQSAATKNIQVLERILGATLFDRRPPGLTPTRYGQRFLTHTEKILATLERSLDELSTMADGNAGHVRVGTLIAASPVLLPRTLKICAALYPEISVEIVEGMNDTLLPKLDTGYLDLVVGRTGSVEDDGRFSERLLYTDPIVVVTRRAHPLAKRDSVTMRELSAQRWILPPRETSLRQELINAFKDAGVAAPFGAVESVALSTNLSLLAQSDYVGALPRQVLLAHADTFKLTSLPTVLESVKTRIGFI